MTDLTAAAMSLQDKKSLLKQYRKSVDGAQPPGQVDAQTLRTKTLEFLKKTLAGTLQLPAHKIQVDTPLENYGIDSVMVMGLTKDLEKALGSLSKTLFFEYQTIGELSEYFLENHRQKFIDLLGLQPAPVQAEAPRPAAVASVPAPRQAEPLPIELRLSAPPSRALDVAIVGLSGRYPQSVDLAAFWDNLRNGVDCITEIPPDRWDWRKYYNPDRTAAGAHFSKWGGFIEGVANFDPLFFNISPREAEYMDPQERLFLEHAWMAVEDAGYTRQTLLGKESDDLYAQIGVYVGVMFGEYQLFGAEQTLLGNPVSLAGVYASIANRVSYLFNLRGPSMVVDTMCSSSLTAIHLACQDIRAGRIAQAIAGGVNVTIHPNKYLMLSGGQFISSRGRCESFGEGGEGYIPGEGVGVVLLKSLERAESDGDHIYGVIRGSTLNHGGKTNGYSVPNPNAQAKAIGDTLKEAGVVPSQISYVEAHGTGTKLGDPIEIAGLTKAFKAAAGNAQAAVNRECWIGSAKSNIGHCESAAGVAGLTKVLLQMKHGKLVPSLHSSTLNPNIDFDATSFKVNQELRDWERPLADGVELPRMAGLSSFGAGGSNAHLVVQEYAQPAQADVAGAPRGCMVVLSARNGERLRDAARKLLDFVAAPADGAQPQLGDIAYTLQVGREAMEERLGLVVETQQELRQKLQRYLDGEQDIEGVYQGKGRGSRELGAIFGGDDEGLRQAIDVWTDRQDYAKVLQLWVRGVDVDWKRMYAGQARKPRRISLPTYPFAKERYWIEMRQPAAASAGASWLHPLVHANTSNLYEQRYSSHFSGQEYFLADHVINGHKILPGVAYLEMARVAVQQATAAGQGAGAVQLGNIVWVRPLQVQDSQQVDIVLAAQPDGSVHFKAYAQPQGQPQEQRVLHAQGQATVGAQEQAPHWDLQALRARMDGGVVDKQRCYEAFAVLGLAYGPGHQAVEAIHVGRQEVLAQLRVPQAQAEGLGQYVLHPSLVDAALQASIGLTPGLQDAQWRAELGRHKPALPFALQGVQVWAACTADMWAWVRPSDDDAGPDSAVRRLSIDLCDGDGKVCVRMVGYSTRTLDSLPKPQAPAARAGDTGVLLASPQWADSAEPVGEAAGGPAFEAHHVLLCGFQGLDAGAIQRALGCQSCLVLASQEASPADRYREHALGMFKALKQLLQAKPGGRTLVQVAIADAQDSVSSFGLAGLLRTAGLENPKIVPQLIGIDGARPDVAAVLKRNRHAAAEVEIRYRDGRRQVLSWQEHVPGADSRPAAVWRDAGVYLITGGLGGLGQLFAKEIAASARDAVLVLTGRSGLDAGKQAQIDCLRTNGARVVYRAVDIGRADEVQALVRGITAEFGGLTGVLHCAGVIHDNYILKKPEDEFARVLDPKVRGVENLDLATLDSALDMFVLFSSNAAVTGNFGQADYACANGFMDSFAQRRNALVARQQRRGRSLSVNWPLWESGGMTVDERSKELMRSTAGIVPLATANGLDAFYKAMATRHDQMFVAEGLLDQLRPKFFALHGGRPARAPAAPATPVAAAQPAAPARAGGGGALADIETQLKGLISKVLKVGSANIESDQELGEFGFDSITFTEFATQIAKHYGLDFAPTAFFEHSSVAALARHLSQRVGSAQPQPQPQAQPQPQRQAPARPVASVPVAQALTGLVSEILKIRPEDIHADEEFSGYGFDSVSLTEFATRISRKFAIEMAPTVFFEHSNIADLARHLSGLVGSASPQARQPVPEEPKPRPGIPAAPLRMPPPVRFAQAAKGPEPVAIIGISGQLPMAEDLDAFWANLQEGRDCISVVPKDRWDWEAFYGDPYKDRNKTNIKWGGFINATPTFDPLFFGISPKEAELMDPQQRLTMMFAYKAIEDAGYDPRSLAGSATGIFVGTNGTGYASLIEQAGVPIEGHSSTGIVSSLGPNRLSYFLDLHGPSEPVETACSSSLLAIHRAVQAIHNGECRMAVAGGVNTIVEPSAHIAFNKAGMLSEDGRCKTFSAAANGYVRGEGVGMLVLKKLSDALADGDSIHALVRGGSVNHGGRANSLTAPNPKAQADVIRAAFTAAGVDPRTVGYIEAHGTGTALGDPIEINGLKAAFGAAMPTAYCGLGSVKSNIGHLELAAGIAGVLKVILQMKHRTLVKTLHCEQVNQYIDLKNSPFYLVDDNRPWRRLKDEHGTELPLRAGVSSFGFGGVNAHIVLEEYVPQHPAQDPAPDGATLVPLSARTKAQLAESAGNLLKFIAAQGTSASLRDVAYTLQVGREAMEERLGLVVKDVQELRQKLQGYLDGRQDLEGVYQGKGRGHPEPEANFGGEGEDPARLLQRWVQGAQVDWKRLYAGQACKPRRISLPTYPFARERYWVEARQPQAPVPAAIPQPVPQRLPVVAEQVQAPPPPPAEASRQAPEQFAERYLKDVIGTALGMAPERIEADRRMESYGLDSIMVLAINNELDKHFRDVPKTLFFEYATLRELARYFATRHAAELAALEGIEPAAATQTTSAAPAVAAPAAVPAVAPQAAPQPQPTQSLQPAAAATAGGAAAPASIDDMIQAGIGQIVFDADEAPAQEAAAPQAQPLLVSDAEVERDPQLAALLRTLDAAKPPVGYIRLVYPMLFITSDRSDYIRLQLDPVGKFMVPFSVPGEAVYRELAATARRMGLTLLVVDEPKDWLARALPRHFPLGVVQKIEVDQFTLEGQKMRKLRYLVDKFGKLPGARTVAFDPASPPPAADLAQLMCQWALSKGNVISSSVACMKDLVEGKLPHGHKAFLTYAGDALVSVIVLSLAEQGGYLMDQEFYDPKAAPLGHMEFAITQIIQLLGAEGIRVFSLGLTWYPLLFDAFAPKDEQGWHWLKAQAGQATLLGKVFELGKANYQFKKKFRTPETPLLIYLPESAPYESVLGFWPVFYQASMPAERVVQQFAQRAPQPAPSKPAGDDWLFELDAGEVALDLMSDSWKYARSDLVRSRGQQLSRLGERSDGIETVRQLFPFRHVILTPSGHDAEQLFYKALAARGRRRIVGSIPWTSTLAAQLQNGFSVSEIPDPAALDRGSAELFRGGLDMQRLQQALREEAGQLAAVGLEVLNNAAGGMPITLEHIAHVRDTLRPHGVPLVLDATRLLRNALLVQRHRPGYAAQDLWSIARETTMGADHVVASLTKDFALPWGGLVATNDDALAEAMRAAQSAHAAPAGMASQICHGLADRGVIEELLSAQMDFATSLYEGLRRCGVPVVGPAWGHAMVVALDGYVQQAGERQHRRAFLEALFRSTGIRGGLHQVGQQRNTSLERCARFALPLGLTAQQQDTVRARLQEALGRPAAAAAPACSQEVDLVG